MTEKSRDAVPGGVEKDSIDKGGYGGSEQGDVVSVTSSINKTLEVGDKIDGLRYEGHGGTER